MSLTFPDNFTSTEPTQLLGVAEGTPNEPAKAAVGATGRASMAATTEAQGRSAIGVESTLLSGAADPTETDGLDGDFWLRTDTNVLFGPKAAGAWPTPGTSLVGPTGPAGADGDDGDDGAPGADGEDGDDGAPGADGTDGTDGNTILNGTVDPDAGDGVNGDFYLNTTSYEFFGPKAGGSWPADGIILSRTDAPQTFTKAQRGDVVELDNSAATIPIDMDDANNFAIVLTDDKTLSNPTNLTAGQSGIISVKNNGGFTLDFGTGWMFPEGTPPAVSTGADSVTLLSYYALAANPVITLAAYDIQTAP